MELLRGTTRRPRPWRRPDVWITGVADDLDPGNQPTVVVCHGAEWLLDPSLADLAPNWWFDSFARATEVAVRSAARTIVPSEYTRGAIVQAWGIASDRVVAIKYGVDPARFRPGANARSPRVSRAIGDRPYVLFVGVPNRAKNPLLLKEAVKQLIDDGYPHALVIVGPRPGSNWDLPEYADEVDAEIPGAPDRFLRIGEIGDDELVPLMSGADVFCLPSIKESFGIPVLEAMACGTPVVVANRAALPEVVGDAGIVCEPTVDAVAASLSRVLSDHSLAAELAARGRRRAEETTWRHAADGYLTVLERTARDASSPR